MVGPIRSSGISGAAAIGRSGSSNDGNRTGGALRQLAGRVAGRVAREFRLLDDGRSDGDDADSFREGEDIYEVLATARNLASELNARPLDEGVIARSLGSFVQESAILLAARPGAASLDAIARVIVENETEREQETLAGSIAQIDQTTRGIAEALPRADGISRSSRG